MIDHGFKTCVLETLKFNQTEIRRRMKEPRVIELADSIKKGVAINPLMVNRKTKTLIAGRDRIAAHMLNETRSAWCHIVDADAKEVESLERAENLYRRQDDRDALIAEEQEALKKTIEAAEKEAPEADAPKEKTKGRKETAVGKARGEIAKKLGTSKEAVRKAAERAKKKVEAKEAPKLTGIKKDMAEVRAAIGLVLKPLISAQSATSKLLTLESLMGRETEPALQRLKQQLHACASVVSLLRPDKTCSYCKGDKLVDGRDCSGCGGAGYLTEGAARVPEAVAAE